MRDGRPAGWHSHQLQHNAATGIRRAFGLEAAPVTDHRISHAGQLRTPMNQCGLCIVTANDVIWAEID